MGGAVNIFHSHDSLAAEKHNSSPCITTNNLTLQIINLFGILNLITTVFKTVTRKAMMTEQSDWCLTSELQPDLKAFAPLTL